MVFEAIGPYSAIGRIAMIEVEAALNAGWTVSVVTARLHESLRGRVEWLKLYNPPRGYALKWLTARHFIKKAMGDPSRFDLIHTHQPQVADLCDVYECHYLTRASWRRGCIDARPGWRGHLARVQEWLILHAEERRLNRLTPKTLVLNCSEMIGEEYESLYGRPARHHVLRYPVPEFRYFREEERRDARRELVGDWDGPVVGFLGGLNHRKGYCEALAASAVDPSLFLLFAGSHSQQVILPAALRRRCRTLGLLDDTTQFYAAIDVLLVPSRFEPLGLVCLEAASFGVHTIASEYVGALSTLEPYGLITRWAPDQPLRPIIERYPAGDEGCISRYQKLNDNQNASAFADDLSAVYAHAMQFKAAGAQAKPFRKTTLQIGGLTE